MNMLNHRRPRSCSHTFVPAPALVLALALVPAIAAVPGCSAEQTEGDFMYLRIAGADLPVWVRGNVGSGVFLVWLSPGPGNPYEVMRGPATDALEADRAVVYWDQRGCGSAQGNPDPSTFTMDQFVADTDAVIELVRQRYRPRAIVLVGHSWGGTVATAYLVDRGRQDKIAAFVDLAGNHDFPRVFPMKLAWLDAWAADRIVAGERAAHWQDVRAWIAEDPPLTRAAFDRWLDEVEDTRAAFYDGSDDFDVDFDLLFRSPQSPLAYLTINRHYVVDSLYRDDEVMRSFAYADRMGAITLPVLALWGRDDGMVPLPAADDALAHLGTPAADRALVVIPEAGHFPFLEQPTAFVAAIDAFLDGSLSNPRPRL
jgi:pimeloyl-ACP methyl ester carboxylesterase